MRARKLPTALVTVAVGVATTAATGLLTASPAMAGTGTVDCETTYPVPGTQLFHYECFLSDFNPANEVWRAPALDAGSNGSDTATGVCRTVTIQYAYYPTVNYTVNGTPQTASTRFLCSFMH
ncbi:MAG: hypothetical protein HOV87_33595 [Catenulispora sp.]|nr:hypothetical protein [Catenulispora sp.]